MFEALKTIKPDLSPKTIMVNFVSFICRNVFGDKFKPQASKKNI